MENIVKQFEDEYTELIEPYIDAKNNLETRIQVLNKDFRRKYKNYPIHNIQGRIKSCESVAKKLQRKGLRLDAEVARNQLMDIAGLRIICYFVKDVHELVRVLKKQQDLVLIKEKDYISNPKKNGYRSYHLILGVPVYHSDGMEYYPVEVQLRTISMDFWASMEHRICYKEEIVEREFMENELAEFADILKQIEMRMEYFYHSEFEDGTGNGT